MGLLDDAIREHLDLKRRRGADPAEVEQAEREALGPVRRKGEDVAVADLDADAPNAEDPRIVPADDALSDPSAPAYDQDHEDDWAYGDDPGLQVAESEPSVSRLRRVEEDEPVERPRSRLFGRRRQEPEDKAPEPDRPDARRPAAVDGETGEYDVDEALETEDGDADEDVLEETPEFLQDTPDHDRLWFEQRPPRDFDFDG